MFGHGDARPSHCSPPPVPVARASGAGCFGSVSCERAPREGVAGDIMGDVANVDRAWPLVGRDATLDDLSSALDGSTSIIVRGPAGVGKSSILRELAVRRADRGDAVIAMSGVDATARLPLTPLFSLLPFDVATHPTHEIMRHALAEVYRRAASGPVVLVVDDAHWLSDEIASFVHQVGEQELATAVVAAPDAAELPEPLEVLWRAGRAIRRQLAPLGFDDVSVLLEAVLGGVVEPATVVRLWEMSRGHPLYLRELVAGAAERGALAVGDHGLWVADEHLVGGHRIAELIRARLDGLAADERDLLVACAAQPDLPHAVAERCVGARAIASLFDRGLLAEVVSGRRRELTPAHPLHAEVAAAMTDPAHRRLVLAKLADAWEAEPGRRAADAAILAELRLGAGAPVAPELLLDAARTPGVDPVRAYELATLDGSAGAGEERVDVTLERAAALARQREWSAAGPLFERAWFAADDQLRPTVARRWMSAAWDNEPDVRAAVALVERLSVSLDDDPALADTVLRARIFTEPLDTVLPVALDRLASPELPDHLRASAQMIAATVQAHRGELADSLWRAEAVADSALLTPLDRTRVGSIVCDDLAWSGRIHDAMGAADELLRAARLDGDVDREITMRHVQQTALTLAGRAAVAAAEGRRTVALVTIAREVHVAPAVLADLALALSMLEDGADEARCTLRDVASLPPSARYLPTSIVELAAAHVATTPHDRRARLAAAAASARERGCLIHLARALHEHHRHGVVPVHDTVADELTEIAATMGGVAALWLREVVATGDGDVDELSAVSLTAEQHGLDLLAVEAAARASHAAVAAGDRGAGHVLGRRFRRLTSRVAGTRLAVGAPLCALTPSEERVMEGACAGSTDRELAERLSVSLRTVHGHLHRSYRKLRLAGRDEIGELVTRHDPPNRGER